MSADTEIEKTPASQIPSWILVGFLVGIVTMWLFQGSEDPRTQVTGGETAAESAEARETSADATTEADEDERDNPLRQGEKPSIEMVEMVFASLREWAFWSDDRTQFAIWNSSTLGFTDHFEVVRLEDGDYFRPISRFSRLPIEGYGPPDSPILFTETAEQRAERFYAANPDKRPRPSDPEPIEFDAIPRPPSGGNR